MFMPFMFGQLPSADLPSGDVDASLDVKKAKKGLFSGLFKSSKGKIEVGELVPASLFYRRAFSDAHVLYTSPSWSWFCCQEFPFPSPPSSALFVISGRAPVAVVFINRPQFMHRRVIPVHRTLSYRC